MKQCLSCKKSKPISAFCIDNSRVDGLRSRCRECTQKDWLKYADAKSCKRYNITPEIYNQMLADQNGVCAICFGDRPPTKRKRLDIDHDHATNKNRGLLCTRCNCLLGYAADRKELLESALNYLAKYKQEN